MREAFSVDRADAAYADHAVEAVLAGQYQEGDLVAEVRQAQLDLRPDEEVPADLRFVEYLPVYSLQGAVAHFGSGQEPELLGWINVDGRIHPGMFVTKSVGRPMEPLIRDGDLCVFRRYEGGTRQGKVALVQWVGLEDPETGGAYGIKRYSSERRVAGDELLGWRITLSPLNPEFDSIDLHTNAEDEVQVIAELVDVLKPPSKDP